MANEGPIDTLLNTTGTFFSLEKVVPEIQTLLELNTNIKMVSAQLGVAAKQSAGFNNQISNMSMFSGLATDSLLKVVSVATKYNKILGTEAVKSAVKFSDATGLDSTRVGEFTSKMMAMGAMSDETYDAMLGKLLQTRDTYGLSTDAMGSLLETTENYYITLGKTNKEIIEASGNMAEFVSRMNSAGIETEIATDILDKMINPDKMQDNIMLMNRLGVSISDMVVGNPVKNLETVAPRLKALAEEITSQPNRMLANEMAKMYGYTLKEMQQMTKIETDQKVIAEQKTLDEYRTQIQTAQQGLKDVTNQVLGAFTLGINAAAQGITKIIGPKAFGLSLAVVMTAFINKQKGVFQKASLHFEESVEKGVRKGAEAFYDKSSGVKNGDSLPKREKIRRIPNSISSEKNVVSNHSKTKGNALLSRRKKPKTVFNSSSANSILDEYDDIMKEGLLQSGKRVKKNATDFEKYKGIPGEMSGFFKVQNEVVEAALGEEASWLMKKSMGLKEEKFKKAPRIKDSDSMADQRLNAERMASDTYEGILGKSAKLSAVDEELEKLNGLKLKLTDSEQERLTALEATKKSLQGSLDKSLEDLTATKTGGKIIGEMYIQNEGIIEDYKTQLRRMEENKNELVNILNEEGNTMSIEQKNLMKKNIENIGKDIKEYESLVDKAEKINKKLVKDKSTAEKLADITEAEINSDLKRTTATIKRINKENKKADKIKGMNEAYGLSEGAGAFARTGARVKTVVGAGASQLDSMTGGLLSKVASLGKFAGPLAAVGAGVGLLVKMGMKDEKVQEQTLRISKAYSQITDKISEVVGGVLSWPMEKMADGVEKIASWKIFDKKEETEKVDDLTKWRKAEVSINEKNMLELISIMGESNKIAGVTARYMKDTNDSAWVAAIEGNVK